MHLCPSRSKLSSLFEARFEHFLHIMAGQRELSKGTTKGQSVMSRFSCDAYSLFKLSSKSFILQETISFDKFWVTRRTDFRDFL